MTPSAIAMRTLSERDWWQERGIIRIGVVNMKWIGERDEDTILAYQVSMPGEDTILAYQVSMPGEVGILAYQVSMPGEVGILAYQDQEYKNICVFFGILSFIFVLTER